MSIVEELNKTIPSLVSSRDIGKDKDKCDGGEDEDGKEPSTPRGRKTANSQGRRKGRITTRSMANEAASVAAEEPPPPEPLLPSEPPQPSKPEPTTQKAVREPTKSAPGEPPMDLNRGGKHLSYSTLLVAHYHPLGGGVYRDASQKDRLMLTKVVY